jgi:hypothetical protein
VQGGYTNPHRKSLDDADSHEQDSLKDALLAKLGKTATLVSDGRRSCAKRPMWNCLLHTSMGVFLIEICNTSRWTRTGCLVGRLGRGQEDATRFRCSCLKPADLHRHSRATLEGVCAHSLSKADPKLVRVHYNLSAPEAKLSVI